MFLGFARPKSAKPLLFLFPKLDLFPEVLGLPAESLVSLGITLSLTLRKLRCLPSSKSF